MNEVMNSVVPSFKNKGVTVGAELPLCNEILVNYCLLVLRIRPMGNDKSIKLHACAM